MSPGIYLSSSYRHFPSDKTQVFSQTPQSTAVHQKCPNIYSLQFRSGIKNMAEIINLDYVDFYNANLFKVIWYDKMQKKMTQNHKWSKTNFCNGKNAAKNNL